MPSPIQNKWTLKKILQNTYMHERNRFQYKIRDYVKVIRIEKVSVYDMKNPGEARTKFVIRTSSFPQYWPYFTKRDRRGRIRSYQRTIHHEYQVTLQLEKLSINVPFKMRVGSEAIWNPNSSAKKVSGMVVESQNYMKGINGDFLFRCEYVWAQEGILFGRCNAKTAPVKTNPYKIVFLPKHAIAMCETLMHSGVLKN